MAGRNSRRAPGNARTMGVKDKPTSGRRRPPANAKKMTVDKAKVMEASKGGKGNVSAKDKKTLRNANVAESKPVNNKYNQPKTPPAKKNPSNVSTKVKDKKLPAKASNRSVVKTASRRTVKDMGKAAVVPKKAIGVAKQAAKSTPLVAVGAGVISASMERTSQLASTGKLSNPMDRFGDKALYGDRLTKKVTKQLPLPKSKPLLSNAGATLTPGTTPTKRPTVKTVDLTKKQSGVTATTPAKKQKTITSGYTPQYAKSGKQMGKSTYNVKPPAPSKPSPKKSNGKSFSANTQKSLDWLMEADW